MTPTTTTTANETSHSHGLPPAYVGQMMQRVRRMARTLRRRLPLSVLEEDLVGAGCLGLAAALARGDTTDPVRFDAFVIQHIRGAMLEELRRGDVMTRGQRQRTRRVAVAAEELRTRLNRPAEHEEVAKASGMTHAQYWETLEATVRSAPVSLDSMADLGCQVAVRSNSDSLPDLVADVRLTWERICTEAQELPDRERLVLDLELGHGLCPVEVARRLKVTKSRVSQLRTRAVTRLREAIGATRSSLLPARPGALRSPLRQRTDEARAVRLSQAPMPAASRTQYRVHRADSPNHEPNTPVTTAARGMASATS